MSITSEIERITEIRGRIRSKLHSLGVFQNTQRSEQQGNFGLSPVFNETLDDCRVAIENMGGAHDVTTMRAENVASRQSARVSEADRRLLVSGNIRENVTILGVTGSCAASNTVPPSYVWEYGESPRPVDTAPTGGYSKVSVKKTESQSITLLPENIREGVKIMEVVGGYKRSVDYFHKGGFGLASPGSGLRTISFPLYKTRSYAKLQQEPVLLYSEAPDVGDIQCVKITVYDSNGHSVTSGDDKTVLLIDYAKWKNAYPDQTNEYCGFVVCDRDNFRIVNMKARGNIFAITHSTETVDGVQVERAYLSVNLSNVPFFVFNNGILIEYQFSNTVNFLSDAEYRCDVKW